jgi:hypothetical protein
VKVYLEVLAPGSLWLPPHDGRLGRAVLLHRLLLLLLLLLRLHVDLERDDRAGKCARGHLDRDKLAV